MRPKRSLRRYAGGFARRFLEALGALAVVAGGAALFTPDLLKDRWWILAVAGVIAGGWALFFLRQKDPEQRFPSESVSIRLVEGDLFAQNASALVGMTTTFDTEPGIIENSSVQGNLLQTIFGGSQVRLDAALASALTGTRSVGTITKPGKQSVYPIGTVAALLGQGAATTAWPTPAWTSTTGPKARSAAS